MNGISTPRRGFAKNPWFQHSSMLKCACSAGKSHASDHFNCTIYRLRKQSPLPEVLPVLARTPHPRSSSSCVRDAEVRQDRARAAVHMGHLNTLRRRICSGSKSVNHSRGHVSLPKSLGGYRSDFMMLTLQRVQRVGISLILDLIVSDSCYVKMSYSDCIIQGSRDALAFYCIHWLRRRPRPNQDQQ